MKTRQTKTKTTIWTLDKEQCSLLSLGYGWCSSIWKDGDNSDEWHTINDNNYRTARQDNVTFHDILEFEGHMGRIRIILNLRVGEVEYLEGGWVFLIRVILFVDHEFDFQCPLLLLYQRAKEQKRCSLFETTQETDVPVSSVDCSCDCRTSMTV